MVWLNPYKSYRSYVCLDIVYCSYSCVDIGLLLGLVEVGPQAENWLKLRFIYTHT